MSRAGEFKTMSQVYRYKDGKRFRCAEYAQSVVDAKRLVFRLRSEGRDAFRRGNVVWVEIEK